MGNCCDCCEADENQASYQKVSTQPPRIQQHAAVCSSNVSFSSCARVCPSCVLCALRMFVLLLAADCSWQLWTKKLSPEEAEERRRKAAEAAEQRAQRFQQVTASVALAAAKGLGTAHETGLIQGGGGENVKAKAKRKEEAERIAAERGPNEHAMQVPWDLSSLCCQSFGLPPAHHSGCVCFLVVGVMRSGESAKAVHRKCCGSDVAA